MSVTRRATTPSAWRSSRREPSSGPRSNPAATSQRSPDWWFPATFPRAAFSSCRSRPKRAETPSTTAAGNSSPRTTRTGKRWPGGRTCRSRARASKSAAFRSPAVLHGVTHFTSLRRAIFFPDPISYHPPHGFLTPLRTAHGVDDRRPRHGGGRARSASHFLAQGNKGARAGPADHEEDPARTGHLHLRPGRGGGGGRVCALAILRIAARRRPGHPARRSAIEALGDQRDRDAAGAGSHERARADRDRRATRRRPTPRRGRRERERRGRAVQARRRSRGEAGMHRAERAADRDLRNSAGVGDGQGSAALRARSEFQAAVGGSPGAGRAGRGAGALRGQIHGAPRRRRRQADLPGIRELERRKIAHRTDPRKIRLVDPRRFPRISASMPPVTQTLLIANVAVFLLQSVNGGLLEEWFALWPPGHGFAIWQLLTYG